MEINELIRELRNRGLHNGSTLGHHSGLYEVAADAMETQQKRIAELEAADKWIPVTERLPKKSGEYLIYRNRHQLCVHYSAEHQMFNCHDFFSAKEALEVRLDCTHWMPLPEPPREETR